MKVIVRGQIPKPAPKWWVGKQFACDNCKTTIELEALDDERITQVNERRPGGKQEIRFCCPVCDEVLTFCYDPS